ncbi:MAG: hypothetical protein LN413_06930 [Candidatus Thermoplasmatota archaeon]|nr:hypothetical protein [Candidatus Thermoplasmatota archaeon]
MSRKQAEGLVRNVKDPELLRAWKKKLDGGAMDSPDVSEEEANQLIDNWNARDEGW